jgi:hypothetical protein
MMITRHMPAARLRRPPGGDLTFRVAGAWSEHSAWVAALATADGAAAGHARRFLMQTRARHPQGLAWRVIDGSGFLRRLRSGRSRFGKSQVEGLLWAERHALGVDPLQMVGCSVGDG